MMTAGDGDRTLRLGVLLSGGGRTLLNILDEIGAGRLHAEVACVIASRFQPAIHAEFLDRRRERFVELGVTFHVKLLVGQFVEQRCNQAVIVPMHHRGDHGIVERAERRVSGYATNNHVVPRREEAPTGGSGSTMPRS